MCGWQPIATARRDGSKVLCWAPGWDPCFLVWKLNPRITDVYAIPFEERSGGRYLAMLKSHPEAYFGDPDEMDDYELAKPGGGPVLWLPVPDPLDVWRRPRLTAAMSA